MPTLVPAGPWESIRSGDFTYQITDEDVLWAARSVMGEGPSDGPEVLWALTQKFGGLARWDSLARFIRAYSQPVNPRWARGGEFCGPGGRYADHSLCSERLLERRARVSSLTWAEIPEGVRALVTRWAKGQLPNPVPRATDFAADYLVERRLAEDPRRRVVHKGGSWFITGARSNAWDENHVMVGAAGAARGPSPVLWALGAFGVVGALVGAWALWRAR